VQPATGQAAQPKESPPNLQEKKQERTASREKSPEKQPKPEARPAPKPHAAGEDAGTNNSQPRRGIKLDLPRGEAINIDDQFDEF